MVTLIAVTALALGIGVNTAVFSIADTVTLGEVLNAIRTELQSP